MPVLHLVIFALGAASGWGWAVMRDPRTPTQRKADALLAETRAQEAAEQRRLRR